MVGPDGEKRPGDVVGNAVHCCRVLVGDIEEPRTGRQRNGGKARAAALSAERRSEIARKAAVARWRTTPDGK